MARTSTIVKEKRKQKTVEKYRMKKMQLKAIIADPNTSDEEKMIARRKISDMPRDAHAVRLTSRCQITGRPKAVYKKFGLCRNKLREMFNDGLIPGMTKSSW